MIPAPIGVPVEAAVAAVDVAGEDVPPEETDAGIGAGTLLAVWGWAAAWARAGAASPGPGSVVDPAGVTIAIRLSNAEWSGLDWCAAEGIAVASAGADRQPP